MKLTMFGQSARWMKLALIGAVAVASLTALPVATQAQGSTGTGKTLSAEWLAGVNAVNLATGFTADVALNRSSAAVGDIAFRYRTPDLTLKRGVVDAASGAVVCERNSPVLIVEGVYYEEIGGRLVAQGPATARASRPAGGGGGDIIVFDIVGVTSQTIMFQASGQLTFNLDPCR